MPKDEVVHAQAGCLCIITPHGGNGAQRRKYGDLGSSGDSEMLDLLFHNLCGKLYYISYFPETNSKSTWTLMGGRRSLPFGFRPIQTGAMLVLGRVYIYIIFIYIYIYTFIYVNGYSLHYCRGQNVDVLLKMLPDQKSGIGAKFGFLGSNLAK